MKKTLNSSNEVFTTMGASNHSNRVREDKDFYSTDPQAIDYLLKHEKFSKYVWECACGNGNLSKRLEEHGHIVKSTDLIYRGYGERESIDFLKQETLFEGDIITNPPFKLANEFVLKALELSNRKVAMFCRIQFLETQKRYLEIFKDNPPKKVLVFVKRIKCFPNNDDTIKSSAICYCWIVWDKGWNGETVLEWINNIDEDDGQQKLSI